MPTQPIVVFITAPNQEVAGQIAEQLVQQKLAACANLISPVQSIFHWDGKVNHETEVMLIVKSRAEIFYDRLVPAVRALHPYEVPEIIALPVMMGLPEYLGWIDEETLAGRP